MSSAWARWRAALISVVIGVHLMLAAPLPQVVYPRDLKREAAQAELEAWADRLSALGVRISSQALGERVIAVTQVVGGAHRGLKQPLRPVLRLTGTGQGWALFATPDTHPPRLEIRVRRGQERDFRALYLQLDPVHTWWRHRLVYRRLRGVWNSAGYRRKPSSSYLSFAGWVSQRVFEEHPDVDEVMVRMLVGRTRVPGDPAPADVRPRFVTRHQRSP